jgi:hypothetical protein
VFFQSTVLNGIGNEENSGVHGMMKPVGIAQSLSELETYMSLI